MNILDFKKDIILENERVILRPLVAEDFSTLEEFSLNEPTLWNYSLQPANGSENLKKYMNMALLARENKDSYPFIVFDKLLDAYAGSTRFYDFQKVHSTIQLGYTWYGEKFWGTGLNKNCKFLMLDFAFSGLGLKRVEFRADARNDRSLAAMKSLGCILEGTLRSSLLADSGHRRDSAVLSILEHEWKEEKRSLLKEKIDKINA